MVQKEHVVFFQKNIADNTDELTDRIFNLSMEREPNNYTNMSDSDLAKRTNIVRELFETIAETMLYKEKSNEVAAKWGEKIGQIAISYGGSSFSDTLTRIGLYKEVIWTFIEEKAQETEYAFKQILEVITRIDDIFNHIVYGFSLSFAREEKRILEDYENKYLKLSTPIVPIKETVAILPIIGEIDQKRADVIMEETLKEASNWNIDWLIIDLSGVYDVNNTFMSHLYRLLDSLILLGITPVLSGIRPDLSMQATKLGLFQSGSNRVKTCSSLKQAIEMLDKKGIN